MAGRDYRAAATWLVSFGINPTEGQPAFYIWLRSTWPDRPAQALLQASAMAEDPALDPGARDSTELSLRSGRPWAPNGMRKPVGIFLRGPVLQHNTGYC